jgi:hypothetical protein
LLFAGFDTDVVFSFAGLRGVVGQASFLLVAALFAGVRLLRMRPSAGAQ